MDSGKPVAKKITFLLFFLLLLAPYCLLLTAHAFAETIVEVNVQDTFNIAADGIRVEERIEHCGRLGADLREKLSGKPDGLPTEKALASFSEKLLALWRKKLPFSLLINGKAVKLYPVSLVFEEAPGIEDPLVLKVSFKTRNFKFKRGDYTLFYSRDTLNRVTGELMSFFRERKEYSKINYLRLVNARMSFASGIKIRSSSQGEIPVSDSQTIYSITMKEPKDKVMAQFRISPESR
ncbi:MAG: hypothetical protein V2A78_13115 [bacterium]